MPASSLILLLVLIRRDNVGLMRHRSVCGGAQQVPVVIVIDKNSPYYISISASSRILYGRRRSRRFLRTVGWSMGGAADFKWGTKQDSRAERAKKNCTPTFPNIGYKQANISRGLLNILKFAVWMSH